MRLIERIPEATPALAGSTEVIAAVLIRDITKARPIPTSTRRGGRAAYALEIVSDDCQNSAPETHSRPKVIGGREPTRWGGRPAIGAIRTIIRGGGRKRTPACSGV